MTHSKKYLRILVAIATILMAIAVVWVALSTIQRVESSNRELADIELPLFEKVHALRAALARQTLLFHKYYLVGDDVEFTQDFARETAVISTIITALKNDLREDGALTELVTHSEKIKTIARRMQSVMRPPTDWDGAREVLAEFEPLNENINALSKELIERIEVRVVERANASLVYTENSLTWTLALGGSALSALLLMLWVDARREAARKEQQLAQQALRQLAYFDPLTSLPNRPAFEDRYAAQRMLPRQSILVLLDLLRLPHISSRLGHSAARDAVVYCARRLAEQAENINAELFHFDGKHFAMVVPKVDLEQVISDLNELRATLRDPFQLNGLEFFLDMAVGLTEYQSDEEMEHVLRRASIASRAVQPTGGIRRYDTVLEQQTRKRIDLETDLRRAIERDELSLHFQPQLDLSTGGVVGAEALLRWRRGDGSWISPAEFIPLAEESDLISLIGSWVLEQAFSVAAYWRSRHPIPLTMAVNISAQQLLGGQLSMQVRDCLDRFSLKPASVELEITESAALFDIEVAIDAMQDLRELGVKLALDDFGTGYSAFSYLTRLPLDKLKIDQSFVRNMLDDKRHEAVARSIVALAKPLSLSVIAEGVEKEEQLLHLMEWGCHEIQGFLLARPMPLDQFDVWLDQHVPRPWQSSFSSI